MDREKSSLENRTDNQKEKKKYYRQKMAVREITSKALQCLRENFKLYQTKFSK